MSVGFSTHSTQTQKSFIYNYEKSLGRRERNRRLNAANSIKRRFGDESSFYNQKRHRFNDTKEELLNPVKRSLRKWYSCEVTTHKNGAVVKDLINVECGSWVVNTFSVELSSKQMLYDFSVGVRTGNVAYTYNPYPIETAITKRFDKDTYELWKQMILDDIPNLKLVISALREEIDVLHQSVCANTRSKRLCKRAGLPVRDDYVYLLPSKYA
jgi:hypothetical protein